MAMQPHKLQELSVSKVEGLTVSDVVLCLAANTESREKIQRLDLSGLIMGDGSVVNRPLAFSSMPSLRTVRLPGTELEDSGLADICTLPQLEVLDISSTHVTDLTPLLDCQGTLKSLSAHGLKCLEMPETRLLLVLNRLQGLRHLDLSHLSLISDGLGVMDQLLEKPGIFPALASLDVSGNREVTDAMMESFLRDRPHMRFVGLLGTQAGFSDFFTAKCSLKACKSE